MNAHTPDHDTWDAGGYCNELVADAEGYGAVCGYRANARSPSKRGRVMPEHSHDRHCVGIILPHIYDGICVWQCSDGETRNRFALAHYGAREWPAELVDAAQRWIDNQHNPKETP